MKTLHWINRRKVTNRRRRTCWLWRLVDTTFALIAMSATIILTLIFIIQQLLK